MGKPQMYKVKSRSEDRWMVGHLALFSADIKTTLPGTMCRYTGYRDNRGKMVFENDLVTAPDGKKYVVEWCPEYGEFGIKPKRGKVITPLFLLSFSLSECELVGNIFDKAA